MTWITDDPEIPEPEVKSHTEVETYGAGEWKASVTLITDWDMRLQTLYNILINGLTWPYDEDSDLIARSGTIKPVQGVRTLTAENINSYTKAEILIDFALVSGEGPSGGTPGTPGGESSEDGVVVYTERVEPNGEMLKLPPSNLEAVTGQWKFLWGPTLATAAPVTAEEAPTRLIVGFDYVIRWIGLTTVPNAFYDAVNHVNSDTVVVAGGKSCAAGTLLCQSPVISRSVVSNVDSNKWDVEARFSYRKDGWNKFWNPLTGTFQSMYRHYNLEAIPAVSLYENFPSTAFASMLP